MWEALISHLRKFIKPLTDYVPDKAHIAMALLCDHRYRRGEIFFWMSDPLLGEQERLARHSQLVEEYTTNDLLPAMVNLRMGSTASDGAPPSHACAQSQQQNTMPPSNSSNLDSDFDVPDILFACDAEPTLDSDRSYRESMMVEARVELQRFRSKEAVASADMSKNPLLWWREHEHLYPMLANAARIFLCCPGSQIECERVFSLCGLTVSLLRNRMTTENLNNVVYLTKNTDPEHELKHILSSANGQSSTSKYLAETNENVLPNVPRSEIFMASEVDADALYDCENIPEGDDAIFENPLDWEQVVQTNSADDDE